MSYLSAYGPSKKRTNRSMYLCYMSEQAVLALSGTSSRIQTLTNPELALKTQVPSFKTHKRIWHLEIIITAAEAAKTLASYPWLSAVFPACISQPAFTFWSWNLRILYVRGSQELDVSGKTSDIAKLTPTKIAWLDSSVVPDIFMKQAHMYFFRLPRKIYWISVLSSS